MPGAALMPPLPMDGDCCGIWACKSPPKIRRGPRVVGSDGPLSSSMLNWIISNCPVALKETCRSSSAWTTPTPRAPCPFCRCLRIDAAGGGLSHVDSSSSSASRFSREGKLPLLVSFGFGDKVRCQDEELSLEFEEATCRIGDVSGSLPPSLRCAAPAKDDAALPSRCCSQKSLLDEAALPDGRSRPPPSGAAGTDAPSPRPLTAVASRRAAADSATPEVRLTRRPSVSPHCRVRPPMAPAGGSSSPLSDRPRLRELVSPALLFRESVLKENGCGLVATAFFFLAALFFRGVALGPRAAASITLCRGEEALDNKARAPSAATLAREDNTSATADVASLLTPSCATVPVAEATATMEAAVVPAVAVGKWPREPERCERDDAAVESTAQAIDGDPSFSRLDRTGLETASATTPAAFEDAAAAAATATACLGMDGVPGRPSTTPSASF
mmetsp:Transcript_21736/g.60734  ORF Transcript_21736/g.60734 Transcript_21736/m.60734 type:complete len:445 (+) Transcript_21736:270-1604(+)